MKVRITKCTYKDWWYNDHIGMELKVSPQIITNIWNEDCYATLEAPLTIGEKVLILKDDCKTIADPSIVGSGRAHRNPQPNCESRVPVCPHCQRAFGDDDMHHQDVDVFALAPNEDCAELSCPGCRKHFFVAGSYIPQYQSYKDAEDYEENHV